MGGTKGLLLYSYNMIKVVCRMRLSPMMGSHIGDSVMGLTRRLDLIPYLIYVVYRMRLSLMMGSHIEDLVMGLTRRLDLIPYLIYVVREK